MVKKSIVLHPAVPDVTTFHITLISLITDFLIFIWPECSSLESVEVAVIWQDSNDFLFNLPNLRLLLVCGSGVDSIIEKISILKSVLVIRLVDNKIKERVSDYVVMAVLNHIRRWNHYIECQREAKWNKATDFYIKPKIGVMGLGLVGEVTVEKLVALGFETCGWVRTDRPRKLAEIYVGDNELYKFARQCSIVVCILPLTYKTQGILCQDFFEQLPKGAYVINVGRGGHLIDADLLHMLHVGHISGACLDVFENEPLPKEHPFWCNTKVTITPHIAGGVDAKFQATYAAEIICHYVNGDKLLGIVDYKANY
jgi:glyoxylate/hydroxypyruvate reductase A